MGRKRNKICGIYKITNLINGKVYVGQSVNILNRWERHRIAYKTKDNVLYRAIRQYGIENFEFSIIEECEPSLLEEKEISYIKEYNSYVNFKDSNGYNMTLGGEGFNGIVGNLNHSSKKVVCDGIKFDSITQLGKYYNGNPRVFASWLNGRIRMHSIFIELGLSYYDEEKHKNFIQYNEDMHDTKGTYEKYLNIRNKAEDAPAFGRVGEKHPLYGKRGNECSGSKSVICLNDLSVYESATIASDELGINHSKLCMCCRGERRTCGGRKWMFLKDYIKMVNYEMFMYIKEGDGNWKM